MMRKVAIGLVPALMMFSGAAANAAPAWQVSEVSGNVKLSENGRSRAAVKGALLASGAMIATAPGARAVIVRGQEFVVISPGTRLRVPEASSPNRIVQLIQDFGSAIFKIEKKSTPHFGVQTPYLAAVVKGTTFTVTVGPEGGEVKVSEGAVEVSTNDGGVSDLIEAGGSASVGKSDLYRLSVEGREPKVIRSSKAPAAGTVTTNPNASPAAALQGGNRSARIEEVRIARAIREEGMALSKATRGMLEGRPVSEHAQAEFN
jgi:collagen type III alpha